MSELSKDEINMRVDEMNALTLAQSFDDLRKTYNARLTALENEIVTLKSLVQQQSQVIGQSMAALMGSGRTELDK